MWETKFTRVGFPELTKFTYKLKHILGGEREKFLTLESHLLSKMPIIGLKDLKPSSSAENEVANSDSTVLLQRGTNEDEKSTDQPQATDQVKGTTTDRKAKKEASRDAPKKERGGSQVRVPNPPFASVPFSLSFLAVFLGVELLLV